MFLKNQNQVCLDAPVVKLVFAPVFDQQHHVQNQNAAIADQSAKPALKAMHQRVVVDQSRQPGQTDRAASHEKRPMLTGLHAQKVLQ
jgi:hypothetical protein